jgi:hypothetical protein
MLDPNIGILDIPSREENSPILPSQALTTN